MTSEDAHNMKEIQERQALLIPQIEALLKDLKLGYNYDSDEKRINAALDEIQTIYDLAHA